jgi:hypothetical protein
LPSASTYSDNYTEKVKLSSSCMMAHAACVSPHSLSISFTPIYWLAESVEEMRQKINLDDAPLPYTDDEGFDKHCTRVEERVR